MSVQELLDALAALGIGPEDYDREPITINDDPVYTWNRPSECRGVHLYTEDYLEKEEE